MLELFKSWTLYLACGIEAGAAAIIALAALEAITLSLRLLLSRNSSSNAKGEDRLRLGRWLSVGLEFELAAGILRTAVAPTWNETGQLAAIIVLRTALNFFLQQEIDKAASQEREATRT